MMVIDVREERGRFPSEGAANLPQGGTTMKAKRSEIMEFDVYGGRTATCFEYVFIKAETARRLSESPKIKVRWTDGAIRGSFTFEEAQKGNPLNYCLYLPLSSPTEFVIAPTMADAKWDDERFVSEDPPDEKTRPLIEALKKAIPPHAEIADLNHRKWLLRKGDPLEERRVKEMLARRQAEELKSKELVHTKGDFAIDLCRRTDSKTISDEVRVNMLSVRNALVSLRRVGVRVEDKEAMLKAISTAERDLSEIRKAVEKLP